MKYYLCAVGNFEGASTIYEECIERQLYQYHKDIPQKGPVSNIVAGDILILVSGKQLKGYGVAEAPPIVSHGGHDEEWCTIHVKGGWRRVDQVVPLPYGVYGHTIRGTKQSIVKEIKASWAIEIIQKLKRLRHENSEEMAFPVYLSELATGLNADDERLRRVNEDDGLETEPNVDKPFYDIPKIQRGLVWNATRCEVLWDSILRGIPIGALSLRPTDDGRWEIFDGQQRVNTIAMGYAPWPQKSEKNKSILWIDLNPKETKERKFVFRVTTPPHPWGYKLSNDEKTDNRLEVAKRREATEALKKCWEHSSEKGARPFTRELWPVDAILPVPFSILRAFVEEREQETDIGFKSFVEYCITKYAKLDDYPHFNWLRIVLTQEVTEPSRWKETITAIKNLSQYVVVAMNCKTLPDDLGLYFKRMNKQGIEPDDEEIQYSLLKSKIPDLKYLDTLAYKRTRPAWLANIAVRFWLSQQEGGEWHGSMSKKDISTIEKHQQDFKLFVERDFPQLLNRLETLLTQSDNGLLRWHVSGLFHHGQGDGLVLYFLREIASGNSCEQFKALATTLLWFSNVNKCAELLWKAPNIQAGLFHAMQQGHLVRLFHRDEIQSWAKAIQSKLQTDDWGDGNQMFQDPYIGNALGCIWNGFDGRRGCSFLLYACRKFVREYFGKYNVFSTEWGEQNRPWDYDHILPKDWGPGNRISNYTYLVKQFLWSIGNSAPLPFSQNRSKNASAPNNYPDGTKESAQNLHVDCQEVDQFEKKKKNFDRIDRDKDASRHFIETTLCRIQCMLQDWYNSCHIDALLSFDNYKDLRRDFFEAFPISLASCSKVEMSKVLVCFVRGERQYPIHRSMDWAQPWLACGICGSIQYQNKGIRCLLGVAPDGKTLEIGIRRHPDVNEMPGGEWWLKCEERPLVAGLETKEIAQYLRDQGNEFSFVPD